MFAKDLLPQFPSLNLTSGVLGAKFWAILFAIGLAISFGCGYYLAYKVESGERFRLIAEHNQAAVEAINKTVEAARVQAMADAETINKLTAAAKKNSSARMIARDAQNAKPIPAACDLDAVSLCAITAAATGTDPESCIADALRAPQGPGK